MRAIKTVATLTATEVKNMIETSTQIDEKLKEKPLKSWWWIWLLIGAAASIGGTIGFKEIKRKFLF